MRIPQPEAPPARRLGAECNHDTTPSAWFRFRPAGARPACCPDCTGRQDAPAEVTPGLVRAGNGGPRLCVRGQCRPCQCAELRGRAHRAAGQVRQAQGRRGQHQPAGVRGQGGRDAGLPRAHAECDPGLRPQELRPERAADRRQRLRLQLRRPAQFAADDLADLHRRQDRRGPEAARGRAHRRQGRAAGNRGTARFPARRTLLRAAPGGHRRGPAPDAARAGRSPARALAPLRSAGADQRRRAALGAGVARRGGARPGQGATRARVGRSLAGPHAAPDQRAAADARRCSSSPRRSNLSPSGCARPSSRIRRWH